MIERLGQAHPHIAKPSQTGVERYLQMGRCWYGLWTMVLDCAIDVCLPASFVTHSNRFADILTRVGYVTPLSLSIVLARPLFLWSGAITMIFLYRVIQKSVYLTNHCDNVPVIGDVHLFAIAIPTVTCRLLPPLATAYLPRWVSSGTRHASVDFYWIVPRTPRRKPSRCIRTK
ncbi:hypothetical protein BDV27DRAFT_164622 [Aspergillus caelatus]|uniref:Uncharacterized protein n=2 Tax=Aspergillus subgen. Circumdati TaxID=2720871 RepID=A0A5N6ZKJ0_9EURO|nr:uncharacterized protein BDV27DRAFT_164622 [Aspergillus caelatus]KAE8357319.1 hypothetical protein BDV27DRAFT_164622 [Aspergillus caelatus]KAE8412198.1 hypothetical protein BDV36DRAFT_301103 [Aspergillus pseudocaelatus]